MRAEIGKLQRDLGVTTIYVTHDQTEAMTLGHRVAVMKKGVLQQIAPPQELYDTPANLFVAGFIGSPAMNLLSATLLRGDNGSYTLALGNESLIVPESVLAARPALAAHIDKPIVVGIRPEDIDGAAGTQPADGRTLRAVAELVEPLGSDLIVHLSTDIPPAAGSDDLAELALAAGEEPLPADEGKATIVARFNPRSTVAVGDTVSVSLDTERLHFFEPESGKAVWK
jgi:multiple sugar transport system ATP-binding protein